MEKEKDKKLSRLEEVACSAGSAEIVERYGSASAEFIKDYRGRDNLASQTLSRSHAKIADYKKSLTDPDSSLRQQAGFSAEIAKTSKSNSQSIINRQDVRLARTDDVPGYGANHPVADHIVVHAGRPDPTTLSQMKFVDNPKRLLNRIACGRDGGKNDLSRYLGANALDVPSDQVKFCRDYCEQRSADLGRQSKTLRELGKHELADLKEREARNFETLREKIRDSGMTRDEALSWRKNPLIQTGKEMLGIGHEAGLQGARIGFATGLAFSTLICCQRLLAGEITAEEAAQSIATAGGLGATGGYATSAAGALLHAGLQQSEHGVARALSTTTAPALAVGVCKSLGRALYRFGRGEIDANELSREATDVLGGTAMSTMSSSMATSAVASATAGASTGTGAGAGATAAALGSIIAPMVAGMVGYLVASQLLQGYREACVEAEASRRRLEETRRACEILGAAADARRAQLQTLFSTRLVEFSEARADLLGAISQLDSEIAAGDFAAAIDRFAHHLGHTLDFPNLEDFDAFMVDEASVLHL